MNQKEKARMSLQMLTWMQEVNARVTFVETEEDETDQVRVEVPTPNSTASKVLNVTEENLQKAINEAKELLRDVNRK